MTFIDRQTSKLLSKEEYFAWIALMKILYLTDVIEGQDIIDRIHDYIELPFV